MTQNTTPWLARVFAGAEIDQLAQALQEKEQAHAAAEAKLAVMEECGFKVTRNPSEMAKLLKAML